MPRASRDLLIDLIPIIAPKPCAATAGFFHTPRTLAFSWLATVAVGWARGRHSLVQII